jgi:hypothetical protein
MMTKNLHATHAQRLVSLCLIVMLLAPAAAIAQQQQSAPQFQLTVDSIMRGAALVGYPPTNVRWSRDGARVFFRWKRADEARLQEPSTYVVERDGTKLRRLQKRKRNSPRPKRATTRAIKRAPCLPKTATSFSTTTVGARAAA